MEDVRYVPDLKKNLISLGCLATKGYEITLKGDSLKVSHGALVLMKGMKKSNLYFLLGNTVTGDAAILEGSEEAASDATKLWHVRLGHAGEKALQGLVK